MKKIKRIAALTLAAALVFGGCAGKEKKEAAEKNGKVKISISNWPVENDAARTQAYAKYVEMLNEKYPDIEVEGNTWTYDLSTFLPMAASGSLPTMYKTPYTEVDKIINANYARDITSTFKTYEYDKKIKEKYLEIVKSDDKFYGVPISASVMGLACNTKLFEKAGLVDENGVPKFPETYDELVETAITIKEKTGQAGLFLPTTNNQGGWIFMNIAWSNGVDFVDYKDGKWVATFDTPECVEAMQFVKDLKWKHDVLQEDILGSIDNFYQRFAADQAAMGFMYGSMWIRPVRLYQLELSTASMGDVPQGKVSKSAVLGGDVFLFNQNATEEQVDAGFKWMEITGDSPVVDDNTIASWKATLESQKADNRLINRDVMSVWDDEEWEKKNKEIRSPYVNVEDKLFEDYFDVSDVDVHLEPEVCAQELYTMLDSALQNVLSDKNSDVAAIVKKTAADFQKDYLDKQ